MKKIIALALVLVLSLSLLVACGDSETESTAAESAAESKAEEATIVGKWECATTIDGAEMVMEFEFKADGTGSAGTNGQVISTFTYTTDGDKLTMTLVGSDGTTDGATFKLEGDTLSITDDEENVTKVFTRVTD